MIAFIFYKDILLAFLLSTSCFYFLRIRRRQLLLRRKSELNDQFKQALFSLSSSLSAGRSFENSIIETVQDLQMLYANPQTYIIVEFNIIVQKLRNGENVETALRQFSERADMDDIRNFSDVLSICKRSGGNLVEVIRRTAAMIGEKIELQQDISLLVAQKRFESRILSFAPLIIVALLSFSSPDYMLPLYEGIIGHLIMTVALILLFLCFTLTNKIMDIQVQSR
jgi:tight adherence protein B